jgi:hypothetical protein
MDEIKEENIGSRRRAGAGQLEGQSAKACNPVPAYAGLIRLQPATGRRGQLWREHCIKAQLVSHQEPVKLNEDLKFWRKEIFFYFHG